ncbi:Fic family protein [Bacteroidota bacterium]
MAHKIWNWLLKNWPHFSYDKNILEKLELQFSQNTGTVLGAIKHIEGVSKDDLLVEILSNEALKTSEIEGEILNRESVQSSIKKNLGLSKDVKKAPPAEFGISEMMVDLYLNYDKTLNHEQLFEWHKMLTNGRRDLTDIGRYRTHESPMQVVSGRLDKPTVHFEAPPSNRMTEEMEQFITWFNEIHDPKYSKMLPLVKAGLAHLYFVCIHPFEDGNGRIARALAEKSIALSTGQPTLISLSHTIEAHKKNYYQALENNNRELEVTDWLLYFGETILEAQQNTLKRIDFIVEKTKFFDRHSSQLNERQLKVVTRLFEAGHTGFDGGLSAKNYVKIAKTSESTATRDLKDLTDKQILIKSGTLKSTRYQLNINTV